MPPRLLYHYTSTVGLIGILTSGRIFASDAEFLNDAQELWHGRGELREALEGEIRANPGTVVGGLTGPEGRIGRMAVALSYLSAVEPARRSVLKPVYVTCFCEDGDLLSQWRGYADPGGYAIGFDAAELEKCVSEDRTYLGLLPVQYGDSAEQDMVKRVIERFPSDETGQVSRGSTIGIEGWAQANHLILSELATIKSKAFQEEAEWRIIADAPAPPAAPSFRAGKVGVIPYRTIDVAKAIREIVVGPGEHAQVRELGVRRLLLPPGPGTHIQVRASAASYRG